MNVIDVFIWCIISSFPLFIVTIVLFGIFLYKHIKLKRSLYRVTLYDGVTGAECDVIVNEEGLDFVLAHLKKNDSHEVRPY